MVVQSNVISRSRLSTIVVCALTITLRSAQAPGNSLLEEGEASLPQPSVVSVSQVSTVEKRELVEWIGLLSRRRVRQILDGVRLLTEPRDVDE